MSKRYSNLWNNPERMDALLADWEAGTVAEQICSTYDMSMSVYRTFSKQCKRDGLVRKTNTLMSAKEGIASYINRKMNRTTDPTTNKANYRSPSGRKKKTTRFERAEDTPLQTMDPDKLRLIRNDGRFKHLSMGDLMAGWSASEFDMDEFHAWLRKQAR
jgi:hypothetical protein